MDRFECRLELGRAPAKKQVDPLDAGLNTNPRTQVVRFISKNKSMEKRVSQLKARVSTLLLNAPATKRVFDIRNPSRTFFRTHVTKGEVHKRDQGENTPSTTMSARSGASSNLDAGPSTVENSFNKRSCYYVQEQLRHCVQGLRGKAQRVGNCDRALPYGSLPGTTSRRRTTT
ncbi:hypothetical protein K491DRAFT_524586 [Lophiostoma macrostomum CBS 122681]|uniref:Uncharacterized protein n=1 Tax=Lophiostoma macrostomum CBS 122681 TaxID=1314788 RepID=A0A6A6SZE0_9PLEO|nr:hypothetical protein K491DRAFT_524586 [Lophiostoma macrostomum CBS 122681]